MQFKAQTKAQLKIKNLRVSTDGNGVSWVRLNAAIVNGNMIDEMRRLSSKMGLKFVTQKTGYKYTDTLIDSRVYDEYLKDVPTDEEVIVYY